MLDNELVDMVKQIQLVRSESNKIEIKAANKGCPKVRDSLSSFSNQSGGGVIIFGVDENDGYEVCGVYDTADLMKKVEDAVSGNDSCDKTAVFRCIYLRQNCRICRDTGDR